VRSVLGLSGGAGSGPTVPEAVAPDPPAPTRALAFWRRRLEDSLTHFDRSGLSGRKTDPSAPTEALVLWQQRFVAAVTRFESSGPEGEGRTAE
jgi:hypothetical protein